MPFPSVSSLEFLLTENTINKEKEKGKPSKWDTFARDFQKELYCAFSLLHQNLLNDLLVIIFQPPVHTNYIVRGQQRNIFLTTEKGPFCIRGKLA